MSGEPALDARLQVRRGAFLLDASLRVAPGEILALLGPNGSGKSTMLQALGGLLPLDSGSVSVAGRTLSLPPALGKPGVPIALPPERRNVGLLGQDPLLFPHLSVLANITFGPRSHGLSRADAVRDAERWLEAVGLAGLGNRKPAQLSGGQQQRVAIARALVAGPDVLLLDEPMAALDVQTAPLIRTLLRESLRSSGTSAVLVTHDVLDALVIADRVAILQSGRIIDEGPKAPVLSRPRNGFIAALAGLNLVQGRVEADGAVRLSDGRRLHGRCAGPQLPIESAASVVFRPSAVEISSAAGPGRANQWRARISTLEPASEGIRVRFEGADAITAQVSAVEVATGGLEAGGEVWLSVPPPEVDVYSSQ